MIFYFSGTGNSKWIAEEIARATDDAAVDLTKRDGYSAVADETVGLVFPVYAWGPPEIVEEFAGKIAMAGGYSFAVCTCGAEAGKTMDRLQEVFPVQGAWSVCMPSSYVPSKMDSPEEIEKKIKAAQKKLPEICRAVSGREAVTDVVRGSGTFFKSLFGYNGFNKFARGTGVYSANERCTGCGRCEEVCHMGVVKMAGGRPEWKYEKCSQCMACINVCPVKAVLYGGKEKDMDRYWFERDAAKYL